MKSTAPTHRNGLFERNINQPCLNNSFDFMRALDEAMVTGKAEAHDVDTR